MFAQIIASPLLQGRGRILKIWPAKPIFSQFADLPSFLAAVVKGGDPAPGGAPKAGIDIVFNGKVNETLDITLKMIVAFGLCFQLPVLLTLMGKAGLASSRGLRRTRKYAIVGILTVAALVTPPDVATQVILFTVVYGLYEISIFLVARVESKKDEEARAEGIIGEGESLFDDEPDEESTPAKTTGPEE